MAIWIQNLTYFLKALFTFCLIQQNTLQRLKYSKASVFIHVLADLLYYCVIEPGISFQLGQTTSLRLKNGTFYHLYEIFDSNFFGRFFTLAYECLIFLLKSLV